MTSRKRDERAVEFPEPDELPEPERPERKRAAKPTAKKPATSVRDLEQAVAETIRGIGMAVTFANEVDGQIIGGSADDLAAALTRLADRNPQVRRILVGLTTGGAWGEVISIVALGVVMPILANHGIGPFAHKEQINDVAPIGEG